MYQVDALKTRARMTTFAEALKGMSLEEKTACALDMKNAANQLYDDQEYAEATQCYLQVQYLHPFQPAQTINNTHTQL